MSLTTLFEKDADALTVKNDDLSAISELAKLAKLHEKDIEDMEAMLKERKDQYRNEFILALSSDGAARRRCRVAWRTETQVGVEFLKDKKVAAPRATHMRYPIPAPDAPRDAEASADAAVDKLDIDSLSQR